MHNVCSVVIGIYQYFGSSKQFAPQKNALLIAQIPKFWPIPTKGLAEKKSAGPLHDLGRVPHAMILDPLLVVLRMHHLEMIMPAMGKAT